MDLARLHETILAYEMNGKPLRIPHGAPLRLRVETQLGYKMMKWIKSIEFVSDYKDIGMSQGGHRGGSHVLWYRCRNLKFPYLNNV